MKIGYPCINNSLPCTTNSTFRLRNYSEARLIETIKNNLSCLNKILEYNQKNNLLFFRISSDLIPFASHPICKFDWKKHFKKEFVEIGNFIKKYKMRISMHPDQFTLINAKDPDIVKRSIAELDYHCEVLDAMGLDTTAKIQIHIGGVYGDKEKSIKRFVSNYKKLPLKIKRRLVIENDHLSYSLKNCLSISKECGIPIIFDSFHHECLNNGETFNESANLAAKTWRKKDGQLMVDYSSQQPGKRNGTHAQTIDLKHFKRFIKETADFNFDLMLEIKDKEESALKAIKVIK
ncbi:MAG: UV DNA damage repair endonuclease UvsE [Candidatus Woesearchaeota archaeon]